MFNHPYAHQADFYSEESTRYGTRRNGDMSSSAVSRANHERIGSRSSILSAHNEDK